MASISAPSLFVEGRLTGPGRIEFADGVITAIEPGETAADVELGEGLLAPGLVDIQVNGYFGADFSNCSDDEFLMVAGRLPETGVTTFLPTIITAPIDQLAARIAAFPAVRDRIAAQGAAQALGLHVEGPFISPDKPGTHNPALIVDPSPANLAPILAAQESGAPIRILTLAPERPGALEAIEALAAAGIIVSMGHTNAIGAEIHAGAQRGATKITHTFNAQRPIGHREPGVAGQAFAEPTLTLGLIADFHHVCGEICDLVFKAAPGRVALVTDAMAAAGMPPGRYRIGDQEVEVSAPGEPPYRIGGDTLAGSALRLDQAVRNMIGRGWAPEEILTAATTTPARTIGAADRGEIAVGRRADLVWFSPEFDVRTTWCGGQVAFQA